MSDPESLLVPVEEWTPTSSDPNDEQFGDVVATASLSAAGEYDAVIVGEPYDGAVIGRRGAADGPAAIRSALAGAKTHHFAEMDNEGRAPSLPTLADLGDVDLPDEDTPNAQEITETVAEAVYDAGTLPVFLGGDNSLTVGNARPLLGAADETGDGAPGDATSTADDRVGVVNFDAHLDVREPQDGPTSGTPYRQLIEGGLDAYTVVGTRHFETSSAYADYVDEAGGDVITADEVVSGLPAVAARIEEATADVDRLFVSVDLDVLDAAAAPGVSAPTPGGLQTRELFDLVRRMGADERVAGFELVETAPSLDPAATPDSPERNRSVIAASRTVAHFLAGVAQRGEP